MTDLNDKYANSDNSLLKTLAGIFAGTDLNKIKRKINSQKKQVLVDLH